MSSKFIDVDTSSRHCSACYEICVYLHSATVFTLDGWYEILSQKLDLYGSA